MVPYKLLILALVCSAPATAETSSEKGSDEIRAAAQFLSLYRTELDCENVGYIQTGEADEHFAPIFLSSDIDSSRSLSRKELQNNPYAPNRSLLGVSFSKMDRNADGSATPDELRQYLNNSVSLIDSNADGDVYPVEYEHALKTGRVLKGAVTPAPPKKKKADFIPPWVRHLKAINHRIAKSPKAPTEEQQ
ncbi:hypothetical protein A3194_15255 [Candidatus Thiodiazotropha endoloripes]|uniref:hypothetical protein n=1 Tax=Candidatus Thiodiazotropha endoloripes TaxID=1818881 RepID=UPI00083D885C|nr:hypothetical protein [Candidatus Thiodiazotropha endoloripes]ODB85106.1 hypothetical protein A3194_15255 [Candidatus Thiodiazotropha endoloripes]